MESWAAPVIPVLATHDSFWPLFILADDEHDVSDEDRAPDGKWTAGPGAPSIPSRKTEEDPDEDDSVDDEDPEKEAPRPGMHHIGDDDDLHARKIVIPPAWTNVQVSDDPTASLQVVGKDTKGRKQYMYSAEHTAHQAAAKFERMKKLHDVIDKLDDNLSKDAESNDTAAAVLLMRHMGMRPGSEGDTKADVPAHGATNLRVSDVKITDDGSMMFDFVGKDGVDIVLPIDNQQIKDTVKSRLAGKQGDERLFDTNEGRAAKYMKKSAPDHKLKDLRTYKANELAAEFIKGVPQPTTKLQAQMARNHIADLVAEKLGNTRTMTLNSYINPTLFEPWQAVINKESMRSDAMSEWLDTTSFSGTDDLEKDNCGLPHVYDDDDDMSIEAHWMFSAIPSDEVN